jgi:translation initiation factor 1
MPKEDDRLVYSTALGDVRQQQPAAAPECVSPPGQQTAYLHRVSKGRGGKVVTLVKNLNLSPNDPHTLSKHLKQACGSGGTVKEGVIEIQGDQREAVAAVLQRLGYRTKIAGG